MFKRFSRLAPRFALATIVFTCMGVARLASANVHATRAGRLAPEAEVTSAPAAPPTDAPARRPSTDAPAAPSDASAAPSDASAAPPTDAPARRTTDADTDADTDTDTDTDTDADADADAPATDDTPTPKEVSQATAEDEGARTQAKSKAKDRSHHRLGSLAVSAGSGYYGIVPYADDQFCGEFATDGDDVDGRKSFCTKGVPWFLEIMGGYGIAKRVDLALTFRINVQPRDYRCKDDADPTTCKGLFVDKIGFGIFPGARFWVSKPQDVFKVGFAVDLYWLHENFSGYRDRALCTGPTDTANGPCPVPENRDADVAAREADISNDDVGFRIGPVFQVDPHHNVGILLQPTARMSFVRWFEFALEVQLGIQARFP